MALKNVPKEVWKGLASIALAIFVVVTLGAPVADAYSARINNFLGITTTTVVSSSDSE